MQNKSLNGVLKVGRILTDVFRLLFQKVEELGNFCFCHVVVRFI